jgi:hypothetical protein
MNKKNIFIYFTVSCRLKPTNYFTIPTCWNIAKQKIFDEVERAKPDGKFLLVTNYNLIFDQTI